MRETVDGKAMSGVSYTLFVGAGFSELDVQWTIEAHKESLGR